MRLPPPSPPDGPSRQEWGHDDGEDRHSYWRAVQHAYAYGLVLGVLLSGVVVWTSVFPRPGADDDAVTIVQLLLLVYCVGAGCVARRRSAAVGVGVLVGGVSALLGVGLAGLTALGVDSVGGAVSRQGGLHLLLMVFVLTLLDTLIGSVCGAVGECVAYPRWFAAQLGAAVRENLAGRISHG